MANETEIKPKRKLSDVMIRGKNTPLWIWIVAIFILFLMILYSSTF